MKLNIIALFIILINFSSAIAVEALTTAAPAATQATTTPWTSMKGVVKDFMNGPSGTIFIMSGVATIYSKTLYSGAAQQEEDSKANVAKLDKIIKSFTDSYAGYCPNGRESLNEPSCYCYTDAGKKNTSRTNSKICIDLWAKNESNLKLDKTNYSLSLYNSDAAGCVTVDGQFDENCRCKKYLDSKGKNACKKETTVSIPTDNFSAGFATSAGLKDLLKYTSNATNGNPRFDLLSPGSLNANALRARQITEQLITKLPPDSKMPTINDGNVDKFASAIMGDGVLKAAMNSSANGSSMNVAAGRSGNPEVENLLKQAQVKAGLDLATGGGGLLNKKDAKKPGMNFNFADDASTGSGPQVLQGFPEENTKTYKYKNSDIVTDNSVSIFEIISNRYVQSGLKRLFDEPAN